MLTGSTSARFGLGVGAPAADQSLTFGDRVVPVVIGAVIALVGAVLVQLWLVPRVDTRKRREQRWEEDVLALGQLLTFDQPRIVGELRSELQRLVLLLEHPPDDVETTAMLKVEHHEAVRAARREFDNMLTRVDWLLDRVVSLAPHAKQLEKLASQSRTYRVRHIGVAILQDRPFFIGRAQLTHDEIHTAADEMSEITWEIVRSLKSLATASPPRNPPTKRARRLAAKLGAQLRRTQRGGSA